MVCSFCPNFRNLIEEWKGNNTKGKYVENREELFALTMDEDKVMGEQNLCKCIYEIFHNYFSFFINSNMKLKQMLRDLIFWLKYIYLSGIFSNSYVYWDHEVEENSNNVTLEMMATQAVKFLQAKDNGNGYFIMIEAGRIDQVMKFSVWKSTVYCSVFLSKKVHLSKQELLL